MTKKSMTLLSVILMASFLLSGCEVIGGIFKAGVWTGIIAVIFIVLIIIFIVAKVFSKKN